MDELKDLEKIRSVVDEMAKMDMSAITAIMDEIALYQPFIISLSKGDSLDLTPGEWSEIIM